MMALMPAPLREKDTNLDSESILNYNLPTKTAFTIRLFIPIDINPKCWNEQAKQISNTNNPFVRPSGTPNIPVVIPWSQAASKANDELDGINKINVSLPILTAPKVAPNIPDGIGSDIISFRKQD